MARRKERMQLVNWQGALIGPGSEWFWAMAQFVVVVVSLYGIYRQLRSQGAANAVQRIESLEGQYDSPRMIYSRLELALHLKYQPPNMAGFFKARSTLDFFINLGNLNDAGYLSVEEIEATWGRSVQIWGALTGPLVEVARRNEGRADIYDLDPLITRLKRREQKSGVEPIALDADNLQRLLDYAIDLNTAALREEAAWQSGVIPAPPPNHRHHE
jgi:hypothetical protein